MPLWDFHLTPGGLSTAEKQELANAITKIYTNYGLPAFYVQVRFHEAGPNSFFFGSGLDHATSVEASQKKHAGLQIWHLARTFETEKAKERFLNAVDKTLNPLFQGKGWHWEYFISEGPRDLWKINGFVPPLPNTELEKEWKRTNEPVDPATFKAAL